MVPVIFHIQELYREIYRTGNKLPKRDKLGLHAHIESACLKMLHLSTQSSLEDKLIKQGTIRKLRVETEVLKRLIRTEYELRIIKEKEYISLEEKLQEISKEATGWEKYAKKNSPQEELF